MKIYQKVPKELEGLELVTLETVLNFILSFYIWLRIKFKTVSYPIILFMKLFIPSASSAAGAQDAMFSGVIGA